MYSVEMPNLKSIKVFISKIPISIMEDLMIHNIKEDFPNFMDMTLLIKANSHSESNFLYYCKFKNFKGKYSSYSIKYIFKN